ncbi:hypothetical protein GXW83_15705 [Streptacidiphilus sp. PB12-B1b]|uniref:hypothetical protein n=1 Tax=Streptacidiphilus sp. PB12-B1b TaxID=2705012 RepID=UPI0015F890D3|nr:hypothetical protein [Streptacidiphilus sp. PB12-B1b]QMU76943.1 hypothetical protein GXW83_15705 [Streptacidiphilus sp. PB12-B1b]
MPPRKVLSAPRVLAAAAAAAAAAAVAVLSPSTAGAAAPHSPVLTVTARTVQQARADVHPDTFTNCTISTSGDIAVTPGTTLPQVTNLCSGSYELAMQNDGNLVIYGPTGAALWYSGTANPGTTDAIGQTDGNFVVYSGGRALWNAGTGGHPGAYTCFQTDGNLVVYAPNSSGTYTCQGSALWDSNT